MKTNIQNILHKSKTIYAVAAILLAIGIFPAVSSAATNPEQAVNCGSGINLVPTEECDVKKQVQKCQSEAGSDAAKAACEPSSNIESLISTIINVISAIVGAVAVIMIIIGGFRFVTAGGDTNNVSSAKNTIMYAIVGLVIVAFAQVIVRFVLQRI